MKIRDRKATKWQENKVSKHQNTRIYISYKYEKYQQINKKNIENENHCSKNSLKIRVKRMFKMNGRKMSQ